MEFAVSPTLAAIEVHVEAAGYRVEINNLPVSHEARAPAKLPT